LPGAPRHPLPPFPIAAVEITGKGPAGILLVQNVRDVSTPHSGAEMLREKPGDRARLVSVDATGHGVYIIGGNSCAWNTTTSRLADGTMPERDVTCRAS
jgi:hypothetical protein